MFMAMSIIKSLDIIAVIKQHMNQSWIELYLYFKRVKIVISVTIPRETDLNIPEIPTPFIIENSTE